LENAVPNQDEEVLPLHVWKLAVKTRDQYKCVACGVHKSELSSPKKLHAHHILPLGRGGENVLSNGQTLCATCHAKAHSGNGWVRNFFFGR
jgi:hypothetical protein